MSRGRMPWAAQLVGKTIVAFDPGDSVVQLGATTRTMHDPTITLDDGSKLRFLAEEHPFGGEYGVFIVLSKKGS